MPRLSSAEWMLTLFTTRERASAITGDLIEEGRASSLNVMRVCLALFLRAVAARPVRMALLVGFGLILQVALRGLAVPLIIRVGWGPEEYSRTILYVTLVAGMVTPLLVGWATAKLGRGDEFTACLALAIAAKVLVLLNALSGGHAWNPGYWQRALHFREDFLPIPFILAAALIMRLRKQSPNAA